MYTQSFLSSSSCWLSDSPHPVYEFVWPALTVTIIHSRTEKDKEQEWESDTCSNTHIWQKHFILIRWLRDSIRFRVSKRNSSLMTRNVVWFWRTFSRTTTSRVSLHFVYLCNPCLSDCRLLTAVGSEFSEGEEKSCVNCIDISIIDYSWEAKQQSFWPKRRMLSGSRKGAGDRTPKKLDSQRH